MRLRVLLQVTYSVSIDAALHAFIISPPTDGKMRPVMTTIYYLLNPEEPRGYIHRNKSHVRHSVSPGNEMLWQASHFLDLLGAYMRQTMHVHHRGRSEYTLITPHPASADKGWTPNMAKRVIGENTASGETRQLFVGGGVWKMSQIPDEDMEKVKEGRIGVDQVGCLITEVVSPGFHWEDHEWLTMDGLRELFAGAPNAEAEVARLSKFVRPDEL